MEAPNDRLRLAELGIQCIQLVGHGPSQVTFTYRPAYLATATLVSLAAIVAVCLGLAVEVFRAAKSSA